MRPIRVLHFVPSFSVGGVESLLMEWRRSMDPALVEQELLVCSARIPSDLEQRYIADGGIIHVIPALSARAFGAYRRGVKSFFAEHNDFDLVHSHDQWDLFVFLYARKYGIKHVAMHAHSIPARYRIVSLRKHILQIYRRLSRRYPNTWFACSRAAATAQFRGAARAQTYLIRNTIDSQAYAFNAETRATYRRELGVEGRFVVGHIGRMAAEKNYPFLLSVFDKLSQIREDAVLLLVGDGPQRQWVEREAERLHISHRVLLTGTRNDVPEIAQAMDLLLLPSTSEGFGLVVIEAQAAGLRCLVSDAVQEETFITPLVEQLPLSAPVEQWAKRAANVGNNYERRDMSEQIFSAGFDSAIEAKRLEGIYLSLIGCR